MTHPLERRWEWRAKSVTEAADLIVACLPPEAQWVLEQPGSYVLSGGFVRDAFVGHPYKDIDIFGPKEEEMERLGLALVVRWPTITFKSKSQTALTFDLPVCGLNTDGTGIIYESRDLQLIWEPYGPEMFDLACCCGYYHSSGQLNVGANALTCIRTGLVGLNDPGPYTLDRIRRLMLRGWDCPTNQLVRAARVYAPSRKGSFDS